MDRDGVLPSRSGDDERRIEVAVQAGDWAGTFGMGPVSRAVNIGEVGTLEEAKTIRRHFEQRAIGAISLQPSVDLNLLDLPDAALSRRHRMSAARGHDKRGPQHRRCYATTHARRYRGVQQHVEPLYGSPNADVAGGTASQVSRYCVLVLKACW